MRKLIGIVIIFCTTCCYGNSSNLNLIISASEIAEKITEAGQQITRDYADKELVVLMVMKGAVCVAADLIRNIDLPFSLEYVRASSYGQNGMTSGTLYLDNFDRLKIEGKDVLVVDDIFETGKTITKIIDKLKEKNPNSIKSLLLLVKDVSRDTSYMPEYVLFHIPDLFVIGYGMDYKEFYRSLPDIRAFPNNTPPF